MMAGVHMFDSLVEKICSLLVLAKGSPSSIAEVYWSIGECLLMEARRIDLDEDINNLVNFSVGVSEMISPRMRQRVLDTGVKHWDERPLVFKVQGRSSSESDLRDKDKMKVAMIGVLAFQLSYDNEYQDVCRMLETFEKENELWVEDDFLG
jgi:hypothetical protein